MVCTSYLYSLRLVDHPVALDPSTELWFFWVGFGLYFKGLKGRDCEFIITFLNEVSFKMGLKYVYAMYTLNF